MGDHGSHGSRASGEPTVVAIRITGTLAQSPGEKRRPPRLAGTEAAENSQEVQRITRRVGFVLILVMAFTMASNPTTGQTLQTQKVPVEGGRGAAVTQVAPGEEAVFEWKAKREGDSS